MKAKLAALQKCVDRGVACLHNKPPGDVCIDESAAPKCAKDLAKISKARTKLLAAIAKKCGAIDYDTLRSLEGLDLGALAKDCDIAGVSVGSLEEYAECVFRLHECAADRMVHFEVPLAPHLLRLVGAQLSAEWCD
jgi:hypothetical protein